ncbi:g7238 [Coccomyxa viridis]|uniref:G7238 protein n=1 Tax=Coccomyxa viridis TaxID=1274662 RepID=A0ABP1FZY2_9CHLO
MNVASSVNTRRQQSQLPDQLPFRNEDADLFSFLDGLGADQSQQNNSNSAAAARGGKAAFLGSVPSWGFAPSQEPPARDSGSASLPGIGMEPTPLPNAPLSSLPLPEIPMGGLPLGEDNLFLTSLGASAQPAYPYQQMPQELQLPSLPLNGPHAGVPARDMPGMPLWTQAPLSSPPLKEDDLGGFVPVPSGGMLSQGHHSGLSRAHGGSGGSLDEGRNSHEDHRHGSHAMPKADAWREKNRLAQKAFRQRQKEKQKFSERQIEELSGRVSALELEKQELQRALDQARHGHQNSSGSTQSHGEVSSPGDDEVVLQLKLGEPEVQIRLTRGDVRTASLKRMASIWKTLVQKIGVCLPEASRDPNSILAQRITELTDEARKIMWALVVHNAGIMGAFLHCNLEDVRSERRVDAQHPEIFSGILERIQLSQAQLTALIKVRRTLLAHIGALLAEREQIGTRIRSIEDVEDTKDGATMHLQELSELIDQVRGNIQAIHVCKSFHMAHAWRDIFRPLQVARFVFFSYPYGTDMLSLITCAAKQAGEPSTHDLLRNYSQISAQDLDKWKAPNAMDMDMFVWQTSDYIRLVA